MLQGCGCEALDASSDHCVPCPRKGARNLSPRRPRLRTSEIASEHATALQKRCLRDCCAPALAAHGCAPHVEIGPLKNQTFVFQGAGRALRAALSTQGARVGTLVVRKHLVEALSSPRSAAAAPERRARQPFFAVFSKLRGTPFDVYTTAQPFKMIFNGTTPGRLQHSIAFPVQNLRLPGRASIDTTCSKKFRRPLGPFFRQAKTQF
jgi:hypothetical protein